MKINIIRIIAAIIPTRAVKMVRTMSSGSFGNFVNTEMFIQERFTIGII